MVFANTGKDVSLMSQATPVPHTEKSTRLKDYLQLTKPSLSIMVVFSSVICYLLAPNVSFDWLNIFLLSAGGFLVTGGANGINQTVEKDTDAQMKRTASRPVAAGRMSQEEGWTVSILMGATGAFLLGYFFNIQCALLALASLFLYAFIYTPWKKKSALAVLIGAFPGALPCLIGWVAGTDVLGPFETFSIGGREVSNSGGWIMFLLQFFWQFPHFWAIAWIAHSDYSRAGFKLLPSDKGPTKFTALQTIIYALLLIPVGILPNLAGMTGMTSLVIVLLANLGLLWLCVQLYRNMDAKSARRVMFGSYIYLPVVFLALLADKVV
jgi:protoheme IX farnesyltransferase